jgi:hypothetical protein
MVAYGNNVIERLPAESEQALQNNVEAIVGTYSELSESLLDAIIDDLLEEETWTEEARYEMLSYYYDEHEKAIAK